MSLPVINWSRRPRFNSLRVQLVIWMALPVAVSLLALSMVEIRSHEQAMTHMVQRQVDLVAHSLGVLIDAHIDQRHGALTQRAGEYLAGEIVTGPTLPGFGAGVALLGGEDVAEEPPAWATLPEVAALANQARGGTAVEAVTVFDPRRGEWVLVLAVPIHEGARATGPVLLGAETVTALLSSHWVAALDPTLLDGMEVRTAAGELLLAQRAAPTDAGESHRGHGMGAVVTGLSTVQPTGWQVAVTKNWRDLVPPVLTFANAALAIVAVATVLSLLSAYFGLRTIVWPLQRLNQAVLRVGEGDFAAVRVPVEGVAEIEELRVALARMSEQIEEYQQELQSYIGAITLGQEEERRRLARDLHDETVQDLIALTHQVEWVTRALARDPAQAAARLEQLRPQVTAIVDGLRRQIQALRPLYLEDLGFVPAVEMLLRQSATAHGLHAEFTVTGDGEAVLSAPTQIAGFRIVQEALNNVVKHADARQVWLRVHVDDTWLTLEVRDDGAGFALPTQLYHLAQEGHFGLVGMKERAQLAGGRLAVTSDVGEGTRVWVQLPRARRERIPDMDAATT